MSLPSRGGRPGPRCGSSPAPADLCRPPVRAAPPRARAASLGTSGHLPALGPALRQDASFPRPPWPFREWAAGRGTLFYPPLLPSERDPLRNGPGAGHGVLTARQGQAARFQPHWALCGHRASQTVQPRVCECHALTDTPHRGGTGAGPSLPACPARGLGPESGGRACVQRAALGAGASSVETQALSCLVQGEDGFPGFKGDMGIKGDRVSVPGRKGAGRRAWAKSVGASGCLGPQGGFSEW